MTSELELLSTLGFTVKSLGSVLDRLCGFTLQLLRGFIEELLQRTLVGGLRCFGATLILSCAACSPSSDEVLGRSSKLTAAEKHEGIFSLISWLSNLRGFSIHIIYIFFGN